MLNSGFRILNENTFKFKEGKLYVMLLRDGDAFGVEIVDNKKTFGRKFAKDRVQATLLFDEISTTLSGFKSISDAEKAIKKLFSLKSIDKLMFILLVDGKILTQADIGEIGKKVHFRLIIKTDFKKDTPQDDALTIFIYETSAHKKPFGVLVGTSKAKDLQFELL